MLQSAVVAVAVVAVAVAVVVVVVAAAARHKFLYFLGALSASSLVLLEMGKFI